MQTQYTFNCWIKVPIVHNASYGTVIGAYNRNGWQIYAGGNNQNGALTLERNSCNPQLSGTKDLRDNNWHFISLIADNGNFKFYIDGIFEASINDNCYPSSGNNNTSNEIFIGEASIF